jgi:uncharacterized membrane protein YkvA (DUF1232 family)
MKRFLAVLLAIKKDILFVYQCMINRKVDRKIKLLILAMVLYLFLPADIVPDIIPFLGQIDDVALIVAVVTWIKHIVPPSHKP